jgi:hypothetical protein
MVIAILFLVFKACDDDDPEPGMTFMTSGFIITGTTGSGNAIAKYFESLPTGTADLSDGTDFIEFFPTSIYDHAIYLPRPDGGNGFSKLAVTSTGDFQEVGVIPTVDGGSFRIAVRDANTGVYQDRSTPDIITVFNPATLLTTGTINMSNGIKPTGEDNRYQRFIFRGTDVFAPIRANAGDTYSGFYLHQASLATSTFVGDTYVEAPGSGGILTVNNFGQGLVDEAGNLYVQDGGSIGTGFFSRIYKVPAGSNEIDDTYVFEPVKNLNPANIFYPTMNGFKLTGGTKAIAKVNADVPQAAIDIIMGFPGDTFEEKLAAFFSDPDALNQVLGILFTAETAYWCELDVVAQTVTPITGVPQLGALATNSVVFKHAGEIYFPVATTTEQAFYKYVPGTPAATKAFDVAGIDLAGGYNIANNN